MMGELTVRQASEYARQRGQHLSISYLDRLARTQPERIGARAVDLPTGIRYYLIDEEALAAYLASDRKRGSRPKAEGEA